MIYTTILSFCVLLFACIIQAVDFKVKVEEEAHLLGIVVVTGVASWDKRPDLWDDKGNFDELQFGALAKVAYGLMGKALEDKGVPAQNAPKIMTALLVRDSPDNKEKYNVYFGSSVRSLPTAKKDPGELLGSIFRVVDDPATPSGFNVVQARISTVLRMCVGLETGEGVPDPVPGKSTEHRKICGEPVALQKYLTEKERDDFTRFDDDDDAHIVAYSGDDNAVYAPCRGDDAGRGLADRLGCRGLAYFTNMKAVGGKNEISDFKGRLPDSADTPEFACA